MTRKGKSRLTVTTANEDTITRVHSSVGSRSKSHAIITEKAKPLQAHDTLAHLTASPADWEYQEHGDISQCLDGGLSTLPEVKETAKSKSAGIKMAKKKRPENSVSAFRIVYHSINLLFNFRMSL
jgi:hypothetical protein